MKINNKRGFTLVEVSLSLVFVAILSLTVAFIINDTIASYRRGVTLKQVNTVGIDLVDDMRAAIQNSSAKSLKDDCKMIYDDYYKGSSAPAEECENDGASKFVTMTRLGNIIGRSTDEVVENIPLYGAFCTGTYSYIWNSGYFFNGEDNAYKVNDTPDMASLKFKITGDSFQNNDICTMSNDDKTMECKDFRLLKVEDGSRAVCMSKATIGGNYDKDGEIKNKKFDPIFDITGLPEVVSEEPIDLLASDETNGGLALYDLYVSTPAESTTKNNLFYSVSFILGTIQGGINITKSGSFCATPDDYEIENFNYCAINKFNFAAQATGG